MHNFSVKSRLDSLLEYPEGGDKYEVATYMIEDHSSVDENAQPHTLKTLLCSCTDMRRGKLCRHWNSGAGQIRVSDALDLDEPDDPESFALHMWGCSTTRPTILAPIEVNPMVGDKKSSFHLPHVTLGPAGPEDLHLEYEKVGVIMAHETIKDMRRTVIEWLSSLPYTEADMRCANPIHVAGTSPLEDRDKYFLADTGTWDRLLLADILTVYTTSWCLECHQTLVPFDYSDTEASW